MSDSISLPFLIMAAGTILFVYMSVVIMELRSAYEESFWKQALKIGGIIFTLITLLFWDWILCSPGSGKKHFYWRPACLYWVSSLCT